MFPQAPQLLESVWVFVWQPVPVLVQSANPLEQVYPPHVPALQAPPAAVLGRAAQFEPQAPQLVGSMLVFSQIPLHAVSLLGQASVSVLFCVRYSTTTLALLGAGLPFAHAGLDLRLARSIVPAGNVSVPAPESTSVRPPAM